MLRRDLISEQRTWVQKGYHETAHSTQQVLTIEKIRRHSSLAYPTSSLAQPSAKRGGALSSKFRWA